jgi:hypothetical protein
MRIGHWPPRQIGRWWLRGLAVEAALILLPLAIGLLVPAEPLSPEQQQLQDFMARTDSQHRGLLPPPPPMSDSQLAAFKTYIRDSVGFEVVRRGDTTTVVALTPRADTLSQGAAAAFTALSRVAMFVAIFMAVVYLPIPLALTGMTLIWLWQRRGRTHGVADV